MANEQCLSLKSRLQEIYFTQGYPFLTLHNHAIEIKKKHQKMQIIRIEIVTSSV